MILLRRRFVLYSTPMSAQRGPLTLVTKRDIVTPKVRRARDALVEAFAEAVDQSGLSRDEAAGRLSHFVSNLWDDLEPYTLRLPQLNMGSASKFGLKREKV